MPNKQQASIGESRAIEARVGRLLRIAFAAALVIALVVPVAESTFVTSAMGKLVMRSIDAAALLAMVLSISRAYLLERKLSGIQRNR
tara:strand:+ start:837 stop:1097 length:261 start_codon:yes stop_codon:yes gene_type:complete